MIGRRKPERPERRIKAGGQMVYDRYSLSGREWFTYAVGGTAACAATAFVFYRSIAAFLIFLPLGILYPLIKRKELAVRRKEALRQQFKEAVLILSSSLGAGYSVENAFAASLRELEELYGAEGMITVEFAYISYQLRMNRTIETLLAEFAARSGLEEIKNFAEIFAVSKRSRGELVSVVDHTVHVISDRLQVREEILTMTAEKQFEQKIMNLVPYFIVFYIEFSSPGFFSQMYVTAAGRVVMTGCLIVYVTACFLALKILNIEL